ncbi:hypothetical protein D0T53_01780 [Dysgonomonas sp. 216]|uniref:hypothetical protein n=1 Tax=Dysgonomonas sp. 216 TaxID=2302934 RepID=UPI0013D13EF6|nr:hypothetical protein [Dysgonomonas sp. 216]NDW17645.1 hypothetical protein [Dysgonomonas sp. 216]
MRFNFYVLRDYLLISKNLLKHLFSAIVLFSFCAYSNAATIDKIGFGNKKELEKHGFSGNNFNIEEGGLKQTALVLLPDSAKKSWEGGSFRFRMKVNPEKQNYFTVKFWGSDVTKGRLILFAEGKQIGYRHLGDIDVLDHGSDEPAYNNRFYYKTNPLPISVTKGKTHIDFEIRSNGPIWGYGGNFEEYQKPLTDPCRGIYALYTHDEGYFVPDKNEKQGMPEKNPTIRTAPGEEVIDQVKEKVSAEIQKLLDSDRPLTQMQIQFLAKSYSVKWAPSYNKKQTIERLVSSIDSLYLRYLNNPELAHRDKATPNPGWFGFGMIGESLWLLDSTVEPYLDQPVDSKDGQNISRRKAYTQMLKESRDWNRARRIQYTNQSMIKDLYGIYYSNKGLQFLKSEDAFPEKQALRYLYESVGLQPWLGSDTPEGPAKPLGDDFIQLTRKGLTKELGYVGTYGEVLDWVAQIYEATRPTPAGEGDRAIRDQLLKIAKARAAFRYQTLDPEGNQVMRVETVVGWRDTSYPGVVIYAQRMTWDGTALEVVTALKDKTLLGYTKQMFDDNQFFKEVAKQLKYDNFRITASLLPLPEQYEWVKANIGSASEKLPMTWSEPDYLFTDEEDGVLALKSGDEILYVSLYWRARYAINNLSRVHYITPSYDRVAVVAVDCEFEPSGLFYTRPNWTDFGFGNGGHRYPGEQSVSIHAGDVLPIAKIPDGIKFKPGNESIYAGKADYYTLRYGKYLIGMNCSADKVFDLQIPAGAKKVTDFSSKSVVTSKVLKVNPFSTVILVVE